jgi:hypothetical protein
MLSKFAIAAVLLFSSCVAQAQPQGREGVMLGNADADHDGKVTRQELLNARAGQFAKLDRNADGIIDDSDSGDRPRAGKRAAAVRVRLDTNEDGKISKDEFVNGAASLFDQFDANRDDVLDIRELDAARGAAKERIRERRQQ